MAKLKKFFIFDFVLIILIGGFYMFTPPKPAQINYGVIFSRQHAKGLGLDWKPAFSAILTELKATHIKIAFQWDLVQPDPDRFDFSDIDWQLQQAAASHAKVVPIIGMKTSRWPECHLPTWVKSLDKPRQQEAILKLLQETIVRYRQHSEIIAWQVENEPLFQFGECPWIDREFLAKEANLVRDLDVKFRPVIISDSGEGSWWFNAARIGDIAGITLYRKAFFKEFNQYVNYPIPPAFYWIKSKLVDLIFKKPVICIELQAEPWCRRQLYDCDAKEQSQTMDLAQFQQNLDFAAKTGLDTFYLWGVEWWYQLKTQQNNPTYWNQAKTLWQ